MTKLFPACVYYNVKFIKASIFFYYSGKMSIFFAFPLLTLVTL